MKYFNFWFGSNNPNGPPCSEMEGGALCGEHAGHHNALRPRGERADERGRLESLSKLKKAKDWSNSSHGGPKRVIREDLRQ